MKKALRDHETSFLRPTEPEQIQGRAARLSLVSRVSDDLAANSLRTSFATATKSIYGACHLYYDGVRRTVLLRFTKHPLASSTMLILIAGITGNLGQKLAIEAHKRGHSVRGLARNRDKIAPDLASKLHSFVETRSYYDIAAIDAACEGLYAMICAYSGIPQLQLDGQLILLRAAERAGITV